MSVVPWFWELVNVGAQAALRTRVRPRVQVQGEVPAGAVLLCAKHGSGWDIPILAHLNRKLRGDRPSFQRGSFVGYPVLGLLGPFMNALGAFPVMRPKEVLRLKRRRSYDREKAVRRMTEVNEAADATRAAILRRGGTLVVFPEGTRDANALRPLHSELELGTALRLEAEDVSTTIWPVVIAYGAKRGWRRREARIQFLDPFPLAGQAASTVLRRIAAIFQEHWVPPQRLAAFSPARTGKGSISEGSLP